MQDTKVQNPTHFVSDTKDTYQTLSGISPEGLYKEKGSKFYGYAFPVKNEAEINDILDKVKKEHHKARHWCYAWQLGTGEQPQFRVNDDGEPSNSAGQPIYGQIQSKDLTNILVVVVRYFGGVKLGVGGLVRAYKSAALDALEQAKIIQKTIDEKFAICFAYKDMNKVQRVIKAIQPDILDQKFEMQCTMHLGIRKSKAKVLQKALEDLRCVSFAE